MTTYINLLAKRGILRISLVFLLLVFSSLFYIQQVSFSKTSNQTGAYSQAYIPNEHFAILFDSNLYTSADVQSKTNTSSANFLRLNLKVKQNLFVDKSQLARNGITKEPNNTL